MAFFEQILYNETMNLTDLHKLTDRKYTPEGYLLVTAKVARAGIQDYGIFEFEKSQLPGHLASKPDDTRLRLLRPDSEVFHPESLASIPNKPVTNHHPDDFVTSINVTQLQVGFSRDSVRVDDGCVIADLVIQDKGIIDSIQRGKNEVSLGYSVDIDWTAGIDEKYGAYDGIQKNIRTNHIAIVWAGRAGSNIKLDDEEKMAKKIKASDADPTEEEKKVEDEEEEEKKVEDEEEEEEEKKANPFEKKDSIPSAELERLKGELAAAKAQIAKLSDSARIDAMIESRIRLIDRAKRLAPEVEAAGKSDLDIQKEVIGDKFDLADKSPEYIGGVFDALVETAGGSEQAAAALKDSTKSTETKSEAEVARDRFIERSKNGWKNKENR